METTEKPEESVSVSTDMTQPTEIASTSMPHTVVEANPNPPKNEVVNWTYADPDTKIVCIIVQTELNLNISYTSEKGENSIRSLVKEFLLAFFSKLCFRQ